MRFVEQIYQNSQHFNTIDNTNNYQGLNQLVSQRGQQRNNRLQENALKIM